VEVSEQSLTGGKSPIGENFVAPVGLDPLAIATTCIREDARRNQEGQLRA
jgi:hypothetical protein